MVYATLSVASISHTILITANLVLDFQYVSLEWKYNTKENTMLYSIETPNNLTEGLANFVAMAHNALERGEVESTKRMLQDLWNDIGSTYVCVEDYPEIPSPVPDYDPEVDGDYSTWLALNNID